MLGFETITKEHEPDGATSPIIEPSGYLFSSDTVNHGAKTLWSYFGTIEAMPNELDYYIAQMKAGRLRIVLGPTTPQTWTVDYREDSGGQFLKRWYDDYTYEPYEEVINEDEVRGIIQRFGGGRIWGADVERAAKKQSSEGDLEDVGERGEGGEEAL
jgi:hypothetical protein